MTSPTIQEGSAIPTQHSCDGTGTSPQLSVAGLPDGTETVAVIVDDPDAPRDEPFVHWLVWNVPASGGTAQIPEGSVPDGAREGANDADGVGYVGPCPPRGDGAHTYRFRVHAVDRSLTLEEGAERDALEAALDGRVLASATLSATYER